ncbi:MAG: hypothetical protein NT040_08690 [Bacteroidetes bacterium]|nr:hypothetical protein [Bacteroidota bacterium]
MTNESVLSGYDERIAALALQLRQYLLRQLPAAGEEADPSARLISYNYGPGYKNIICVILLSQKGVKLGF